jgi:hypothetical protein
MLATTTPPVVRQATASAVRPRAYSPCLDRRQSARSGSGQKTLGSMAISIPLLAIAAVFTGLAGVITVCAALALIAIVSSR